MGKARIGRPPKPEHERVQHWGIFVNADLKPQAEKLKKLMDRRKEGCVTWSEVIGVAIREAIERRSR